MKHEKLNLDKKTDVCKNSLYLFLTKQKYSKNLQQSKIGCVCVVVYRKISGMALFFNLNGETMTKLARTEKEGLQYEKSGNGLVDFLSKSAAQRANVISGTDNLIPLFNEAYKDDKETATKLLFRLRDPRSGSGEKAAFSKILYYVYNNSPEAIIDNLEGVVKYGSYQSLLKLAKYIRKHDNSNYSKIIAFFADKVKSKDRLANKWAPRLHSDDDSIAKDLRTALGMSNKEYRIWVKDNSETIEQTMTQGRWSDVEYEKIPSMAMKKYKRAFVRRDNVRFNEFKKDDSKKSNSGVLYPHDIIQMLDEDVDLAEKMWKNLPDFIAENKKIFPIIDVSDSMNQDVTTGKNRVTAMQVAIALGIYLAQRNKSIFKNHFLTFHEYPTIMSFEDDISLCEIIEIVGNAPWGGTTNFEASYRLILKMAIENNAKQEDLPDILLCLSDMQFDQASRNEPHIKVFQKMFADNGYIAPKLVFWNLKECYTGSPARWNQQNVGLISGFSPSIMKAVLAVKDFNPLEIVYESVEYIDDLIFNNFPDKLKFSKSFEISNDLL